MNIIPIPSRGVLIFLPGRFIPEPPAPPPADPNALPVSATIPGWPAWLEGIWNGEPYHFYLWNDAGQPSETGVTSPYARYGRHFPPPQPPEPHPDRVNRDGSWLYKPKDNQQPGTCEFDQVPYD